MPHCSSKLDANKQGHFKLRIAMLQVYSAPGVQCSLVPTCHILRYHWLMPSAGSTLQRPGSWQMLNRQPAAEMALPPLVPLLLPPAW